MFIHITGIVYMIKKWVRHMPIVRVGCSWLDITVINLFDQNVGMACAKARLRFT